MAKLALRRANSLPLHAAEVLAASPPCQLLQPLEGARASAMQSGSVDPRSPTATATFSPVFDLELGGSCTATPLDAQRRASRSSLPRGQQPGALAAAAAGAQCADRPKVPSALARQQMNVLKAAAVPTAAPGLDRSQSDLQVMLLHHGGAKVAAAANAEPQTAEGERLLQLCMPATELEMELARRLRAFRNSRIAKPHSATLTQSGSGCAPGAAAATAAAGPSGPTPGEIEALAAELQAAGFIVQVLDGTRLSKDARSCLRTLKHRFLVCLGWSQPQATQQQQQQRAHTAGAAPGAGAAPALQPQRLAEPLVVEVRFREQFLIANPTRAYEHLLLALPVAFVGPLRRLDAAVELVAAAVAVVFRQAGRPLPPWRTKGAMLSKWAPMQLVEMERRMQAAAAQAALVEQQQQQPGQSDTEVSWGSAIIVTEPDTVATGPGMGAGAVAGGMQPPYTSAEAFAFVDLDDPEQDPEGGDSSVGRSHSEPLLSLQRTRRNSIAAAAAEAAAARLSAEAPAGTCHGHMLVLDMDIGAERDCQEGQALQESAASATGPDGRDAGAEEELPSALSIAMAPPSEGRPADAAEAASAPAAAQGAQNSARGEWRGFSALAPPCSGATGKSAASDGTSGGGITFPLLPELPAAGPAPLLGPSLAPLQTQALPRPPARGRSPFSPFASVSTPEGQEREAVRSVFGDAFPGTTPQLVVRPQGTELAEATSLNCATQLPEFTLKHSTLAPPPAAQAMHRQHDTTSDQDRNARGVAAARAATLPMPTPVRAAPLHYAAAVDAAGDGLTFLRPPLASPALGSDPAAPAAAPGKRGRDLAREHEGELAAAAAAVAAAEAVVAHADGAAGADGCGIPNAVGRISGGGFASLQFVDMLSITRRSSSDLSRAATKFKNAKSLLAAALRRATGSKDGSVGGAGGSPDASIAPLQQHLPPLQEQEPPQQQEPQQQPQPLRDGVTRDSRDRRTADTDAKKLAAGAAAGPTQVMLPGGVMTRPSTDEPAWARITTVRWGQPAAGAAAAARQPTAAASAQGP